MDGTLDVMGLMMKHIEPFGGTDPNTSGEWYCKKCGQCAGEIRDPDRHGEEEDEPVDDELIRLSKCSRCKLVRYCGRKCQRADFQEHKEECMAISRAMKEVRKLQAQLEYIEPILGGPKENMFETSVGHFWGLPDTRDYCRARNHLSNCIEHLAHWYEVKMVIEESLKHKISLLRLNMSDNMGLRSDVPFTLLKLNRDGHCMAFITHWMERYENEDDDEIEIIHSASTEGDWLYGDVEGEDILYQDVHFISGRGNFTFDLNFMMAVLIVKLRLIIKHEHDVKQLKIFERTIAGRLLGQKPLTIIGNALHGGTTQARKIDQQRRLVYTYMDEIDDKNPTILPSILNPGPLKSQPEPQYFSPGRPSEAYFTLKRCNRLFCRIPGAESVLQHRYGRTPFYDYNIGPY